MARDFNGNTANYLQVGDPDAVDLTGTNITVACWVQFDGVVAEQGLVTKYGATAPVQQFALELLSSRIDFAVTGGGGGTLCQGSTTVSAGPWYHFCGMQTATDVFVFLNGAQDGTNVNQRPLASTTALLQFGKFESAGLALDGRLAEVAIWATNLSAAEIAQVAGGTSPLNIQAASLRGYWPLCGTGVPEPDFKLGNPASIVGTVPAATHLGPGYPCATPTGPQQHRVGKGSAW